MYFQILVVLGISLYVLLIFGLRSLRKVRNRIETPGETEFSIEKLSQLRDQGLLSEEEFVKARDSILARGGREMMLPTAGMPPVVAPPPKPQPRGFEVVQRKPEPPPAPPKL